MTDEPSWEQPRLFKWDDESKPRRKRQPGSLAPRPPGYQLVTTRNGVVGYHLCSVPDPTFAKNHSVVTRCGIVGRVIQEYDQRAVVLCPECEKKGGW